MSAPATSGLIRAAEKVADWFEAQATRNEKKAETERFISLRNAYVFDAKNYRAMALDLRTAIKQARGGR